MPGTPRGCPASAVSGARGRSTGSSGRRPRPWTTSVALDDVAAAGCRSAGGSGGPRARAAGPLPHRPEQPPGDDAPRARPGDRAGQRQDEEEADDVGDEARGEQQRAADEHERGVGELAARHPTAAQRLLQGGQVRAPSRLTIQAPSTDSRTSSSRVCQPPMTRPTAMIAAISTIGTMSRARKTQRSTRGRRAGRRRTGWRRCGSQRRATSARGCRRPAHGPGGRGGARPSR